LIPSIVWPNMHPLLEDQSATFVKLAQNTDLRTAPALVKLMPRVIDRILSRRPADTASVPILFAMAAASTEREQGSADRLRACLSVISAKARELPDADITDLKAGMQPILQKILSGKSQ